MVQQIKPYLKLLLFYEAFTDPVDTLKQGWGAGVGADRSRVFLALWSRSRLKKKSGAGAAKKEDKKHNEIVLFLLFFR